jgi:hypothetical protein
MRTRRTLAAAVAAVAIALAGAAGGVDHEAESHSTVRIGGGSVHPQTLTMASSDALLWANYSSRIARVSFDRAVAEKIRCAQRASFTLDGDRLASPQIQANQFASLCKLAPGTYEYRVELFAGAGTGGAGGPERTFTGKIVVQ